MLEQFIDSNYSAVDSLIVYCSLNCVADHRVPVVPFTLCCESRVKRKGQVPIIQHLIEQKELLSQEILLYQSHFKNSEHYCKLLKYKYRA